ncbi:MAG TPA: methyltransferase domain-containing protein [Stellaceae bacterium]|nr:methyltransferase domain-containing protein [Stellaceae bacterium]
MADRTESAAPPSFFARILARLRGEQPASSPDSAAPVAAPPGAKATAPRRAGEPQAPLDPLTVRQWLWGPGFIVPGTAEYVLGLVKPFAANPAMSILDIAAGLGGPARVIADAFGTYITGLERDPETAGRGMAMSVAAGKQKHAAINVMNPETLELKAGAFDCIFGRGATYAVQDKERFMRVLIMGLKPRGQLLLTDHVVDPALAQRPELAAWRALEPFPPALWNVQQYTDCFKSLGFDVRISEDITTQYKAQIVLGWDNLLQSVDIRKLPRAHQLTVLDEAERWVKTIIALDSGALKVYRFYALAGSARPPAAAKKKK